MSLLDKQEVQDICEHTVLRARKWSGFNVNDRQKMRYYRDRSAEERRRRRRKEEKKKKMKKKRRRRRNNAKSLFFTSRCAYVNLRYISMLYTHSIANQP